MQLKKAWKLKKISLADCSASAEKQQESKPHMDYVKPDSKFENRKHKKSHSNTLPPDTYKPIISSERLLTRVEKNGERWKKEFLEVEVIRSGEDGLPMVSLKQLRATEKNPTPLEVKNRDIKIPLEMLDILIDTLDDISYHTQDVLNELL